jgi:hypothetical protein
MKALSRTACSLPAIVATQSSGNAAITVSNTNDAGPGSLRQAILGANDIPGPDKSGTASVPNNQAIDASSAAGFADNRIGGTAGANARNVISGNISKFSISALVRSLAESWRLAHFGTAANSGIAVDSADPDGDGDENLLERAFGTNPAIGQAGPIAVSGGAITPGDPLILRDGSGFLALYGRRKDHVAAGLSFTVPFSADLDQQCHAHGDCRRWRNAGGDCALSSRHPVFPHQGDRTVNPSRAGETEAMQHNVIMNTTLRAIRGAHRI